MLFDEIVSEIESIGKHVHTHHLLNNAKRNSIYVNSTIKELEKPTGDKARKAIVISAGPSIKGRDVVGRLKKRGFSGSIIAVDGSLVRCLEGGIVPDYVVTLDPHPTRIIRWFGDPDIVENTKDDDYFSRQDLDVSFRENRLESNKRNIDLINEYAKNIKLLICTSSPENVVRRAISAGFQIHWWNPLVDDPRHVNSLTRDIYNIVRAPCINTGGTVGTASWVMAVNVLGIPLVGVAGMDFGYPAETPIENTQTYYELIKHLNSADQIEECFRQYVFPLTGEKFYTDPTYYWYRQNFLELESKSISKTINCTEGGTLVDDRIECLSLEDFLGGS